MVIVLQCVDCWRVSQSKRFRYGPCVWRFHHHVFSRNGIRRQQYWCHKQSREIYYMMFYSHWICCEVCKVFVWNLSQAQIFVCKNTNKKATSGKVGILLPIYFGISCNLSVLWHMKNYGFGNTGQFAFMLYAGHSRSRFWGFCLDVYRFRFSEQFPDG